MTTELASAGINEPCTATLKLAAKRHGSARFENGQVSGTQVEITSVDASLVCESQALVSGQFYMFLCYGPQGGSRIFNITCAPTRGTLRASCRIRGSQRHVLAVLSGTNVNVQTGSSCSDLSLECCCPYRPLLVPRVFHDSPPLERALLGFFMEASSALKPPRSDAGRRRVL